MVAVANRCRRPAKWRELSRATGLQAFREPGSSLITVLLLSTFETCSISVAPMNCRSAKVSRSWPIGGISNKVFGGWSVNWAAVLQGGQPITLSCPSSTTSGTGCYDLIVPGQDQKRGLHIDSNGKLSFFGNPGAFNQPCVLGAGGVPDPTKVVGCVPLTGLAALGGPPAQIAGPTFKRLDFSVFKDMRLSERFTLQFRAEFFNIFNHPNFNAPGFGGNGVVAVSGATNFTSSNFGEIGSTRDAPYDPRQIQFALKLYY